MPVVLEVLCDHNGDEYQGYYAEGHISPEEFLAAFPAAEVEYGVYADEDQKPTVDDVRYIWWVLEGDDEDEMFWRFASEGDEGAKEFTIVVGGWV